MDCLEANDLLSIFGNSMELFGLAETSDIPIHHCDTGRMAFWNADGFLGFSGTKLEHRERRCYMWITGDRPVYRTGERIESLQGVQRSDGKSICPVQ
jgi:hypothetical protein